MNDKKQTQIWLEDYDLAYVMKKAGFGGTCNFTIQYSETADSNFVCFQGRKMFELPIDYLHLTIKHIRLELPTLGEIILPKYLEIRKDSSTSFSIVHLFYETHVNICRWLYDKGIKNDFDNELTARCYAWLWANENNN